MAEAAAKLARWRLVALFAAVIFAGSAVAAPLNLQTEQQSDFFTFFHLTPAGAPSAIAGGQAWHSFRPSGPAFHDLVEVDILAGADGAISAARIAVDRSFIDSPSNGVFARDIAKSFLSWSIRNPSPQIANLIANLADLSGTGGTVIMRGTPSPPPPDATGLYNVYLGHAPRATLTDGGVTLAFTNFPGTLPADRAFAAETAPAGGDKAGWLRIDVDL